MVPTLPSLNRNVTARKALGLMRLNEANVEDVENSQADRAKRLADLFDSEVWIKDIVPILMRIHDEYLENVKAKKLDSDALKGLDEFVFRLGGTVQLGIGAMHRIAERRLKASEKVAELNERSLVGNNTY